MITMKFLCRLTPGQWAVVNRSKPDGFYTGRTDWFVASGLYRRDVEPFLVIIQFSRPGKFRSWKYEDVFLSAGRETRLELEELVERCEELAASYEENHQHGQAEHWRLVGQGYINEAYFPNL